MKKIYKEIYRDEKENPDVQINHERSQKELREDISYGKKLGKKLLIY